ncbi:MAG: hypothetical protein DYH12_03960 [Sorangiineae bacterium PRO1]|nr:hypothetical protein [Sorangiineae bacterium PRO1]
MYLSGSRPEGTPAAPLEGTCAFTRSWVTDCARSGASRVSCSRAAATETAGLGGGGAPAAGRGGGSTRGFGGGSCLPPAGTAGRWGLGGGPPGRPGG